MSGYTIEILPVVVADEPDAHRLQFKVGVQSFHIGPDYLESREHAEWFAGQFRHALGAIHDAEIDRLRDLLGNARDYLEGLEIADEIDAALSSPLGQGAEGCNMPVEGVARAEVVATPGTPGGGAGGQASSANVDWLGLALDLEAQARRVESQTVERAMLAGAHGLRLMGAEQ